MSTLVFQRQPVRTSKNPPISVEVTLPKPKTVTSSFIRQSDPTFLPRLIQKQDKKNSALVVSLIGTNASQLRGEFTQWSLRAKPIKIGKDPAETDSQKPAPLKVSAETNVNVELP